MCKILLPEIGRKPDHHAIRFTADDIHWHRGLSPRLEDRAVLYMREEGLVARLTRSSQIDQPGFSWGIRRRKEVSSSWAPFAPWREEYSASRTAGL